LEVKNRVRTVLFSSPSRQACLDWELENLIKP